MARFQEPEHSGSLLYEKKSFLWRIPNYAELWNLEREIGSPYCFTISDDKSSSDEALLGTCKFMVGKPNQRGVKLMAGGLFLQKIPPRLSKARAKIRVQVAENYIQNFGFEDGIVVSLEKEQSFVIPLPQLVELTDDGALEIRIEITIFHHSVGQNAELAALEAQYKSRFKRTFCHQLTTICKKFTNHQDIKVVSKDGVQHSANRAVLAARSPVFQKMFESGMRDKQSDLVEVKDVDSEPLEVLLHFINTGELAKNWKDEGVIEGLVYAAHKYMLEDLKYFLGEILGLVCTKGNCGKLSGLARAFRLGKAELQLLTYFKENLAQNLEEVGKFVKDMAMMRELVALPSPESVGTEEQDNGEKSPKKKSRWN